MNTTKHILETLIEGELVMIRREPDENRRNQYMNNVVEYSTMYKALTGHYYTK